MPPVAERVSFDVLVVGSGASGLAAAVSAERAGARVALATKGSLQSCNSAKAQGGIQAAFGEDDSPEQHAEDVWQSSHETADRELVEVLTAEAPAAIHWLEEHGRRVHARERRLPAGALRRRDPQAAPAGRRPHGPRDHDGAARRVRGLGRRGASRTPARRRSSRPRTAGSRPAGARRRRARDRRRRGRARRRRPLLPRGRGARRALDEPSRRDRRGDAAGARARRRGRDLDALQYHPNGGAWPPTMQGYSIPETTRAYGATLLNADGEEFTDSLGPRDAVSQAIFDEVEAGRGVETPDGRPAVCSTRRASPRQTPRSRSRTCSAATVRPGSTRCGEPILTYPVLHYQNGGLVIDEHAETTLAGLYACGEIAGGTHGRNRMMGNSLLECCVFGRRAGRRGRGAGGMSAVATDLQQAVEDAAAHLYVWALKDIPQDLRDALADARERETSVPGRRVLDTILKNVQVADDREQPRLPGHGHRRLHLPRRRALPAAPGADLRGAARPAPSARRSSTRCARTPCTRSRARTPGRTSATGCRSSTGSSSPTGTASTSSACRRARAPRT